MSYGPTNTRSSFLSVSEVFPLDPKEQIIKLSNLHTNIANAVNTREISVYQDGTQTPTGQQFILPGVGLQQGVAYRKTFTFGAIAAGATLNIAHGLTNLSSVIHWKGGVVTAVPDYRPLPYVSSTVVTNQVAVLVTAANIVITNGATAPNILNGMIMIEYLYT